MPKPKPKPSAVPILLAALLLASCASSPPARFYALSPLPEVAANPMRAPGGLTIALGPVSVPVYLDRQQLVWRPAPNQLLIDEFARWGGSLPDDFVRVWGENLAWLLDTSRIQPVPGERRDPAEFRIIVELLAFEGRGADTAVLEARWAILDPRQERTLTVRESRYRRTLDAPGGTAELAAALSALLGEFSREVAAALRALPRADG